MMLFGVMCWCRVVSVLFDKNFYTSMLLTKFLAIKKYLFIKIDIKRARDIIPIRIQIPWAGVRFAGSHAESSRFSAARSAPEPDIPNGRAEPNRAARSRLGS